MAGGRDVLGHRREREKRDSRRQSSFLRAPVNSVLEGKGKKNQKGTTTVTEKRRKRE